MEGIKLRDLKIGEFFTLKPLEYPTENQVYIKERDSYDRSSKKYYCSKWGDYCYSRAFSPDRIVYTDFIF